MQLIQQYLCLMQILLNNGWFRQGVINGLPCKQADQSRYFCTN